MPAWWTDNGLMNVKEMDGDVCNGECFTRASPIAGHYSAALSYASSAFYQKRVLLNGERRPKADLAGSRWRIEGRAECSCSSGSCTLFLCDDDRLLDQGRLATSLILALRPGTWVIVPCSQSISQHQHRPHDPLCCMEWITPPGREAILLDIHIHPDALCR